MRVLLDTHIFLWFISGDRRLSIKHLEIIRNLDNQIYLSVLSIWEVIVKYQLGKLPFPEHPALYLPKQRDRHHIINLDLDQASVVQLLNLPPLHRDPFDRMLIGQALHHNLTLLTMDAALYPYPVNRI